MKVRTLTYGIGGYLTDKPSDNLISDVTLTVPGLGSDRMSIPPDGVTAATLNYERTNPTETTANWTINGVAHAEALDVNGVNEIQVTATVAGSLVVACNKESLTLTVA